MMTFVLVAHVRIITWNWSFSVDQKFFKVKITFNQLTKVSKFLDLQKKRTFHQLTKVLKSNLVSWLKSLKDQIFWSTENRTFDQLSKMKNLSIYWKTAQKTFDRLKKISLGVSICLDRVLIKTLDHNTGRELVSTVKKILTISKSLTWRLRSLNRDGEILILSIHHLPVSKVSIEIKKSVDTWHFWQILTVCLDLDRELVNFIIFLDCNFSICQNFWSRSTSKSHNNVEKSW